MFGFDLTPFRSGAELQLASGAFARVGLNSRVSSSFTQLTGTLSPIINGIANANAEYGKAISALGSIKQNAYDSLSSVGMQPVMGFQWIAFILGAPTIPWQYIVSATTPQLQYDSKGIFRAGKNRYYASAYSSDDFNMTFITDVGGEVATTLSKWMRGPYREDGFWSVPGAYKREVIIYLLDQKNFEVFAWKFHGVWARNWNSYNLGTASDVLVTEVTFSVDDVEFISVDKTLERYGRNF